MASKSLLGSLDYRVTIKTFTFIDTEPNPFKFKWRVLLREGGGGVNLAIRLLNEKVSMLCSRFAVIIFVCGYSLTGIAHF